MPPWLPVKGYGKFAGERRLTDSEIVTIVNWAKAGAPVEYLPQPTSLPGKAKPDLIVEMPEPYTIAAHGPDEYRCFTLPVNLSHDVFIKAVDFRPSNRAVVHHALIFAGRDQPASYSCFGTPGFIPSTSFGGWSPGTGLIEMPESAAIRLRAGSSLVVQEHFHSRGAAEQERSRVALYLTDRAPSRAVMDVGLVSRDIDIPAGESAYKVRDHFEIPVDVHAIGIIPHAHYVCRDMKGWATLPNGRRQWLIWIKDWDFNWQEHYRYAAPVALPAGTRVEMEFTYDNSAANPHNPNSPPKRVTWGGDSSDEMAGLHIQVICDRPGDVSELGQALWGKVMRMVGGRFD